MTPVLTALSIDKLSRAELLVLVKDCEHRMMFRAIDQEAIARAVHTVAMNFCREKSAAWQGLADQAAKLRSAAGPAAEMPKSISIRSKWRKIRAAENLRDEAWEAYERANRAQERAWARLEAIWKLDREKRP